MILYILLWLSLKHPISWHEQCCISASMHRTTSLFLLLADVVSATITQSSNCKRKPTPLIRSHKALQTWSRPLSKHYSYRTLLALVLWNRHILNRLKLIRLLSRLIAIAPFRSHPRQLLSLLHDIMTFMILYNTVYCSSDTSFVFKSAPQSEMMCLVR